LKPVKILRPDFPKGYVENPKAMVPWSHVEQRLTSAINYWLCSVRPNGKPHAIPKWAVWVNDRVYFDGSPETRHARNIANNPYVSLHLESGDEVVILEGVAHSLSKPEPQLANEVAQAYTIKYAALGYAPQPDQWDGGGLFEIEPYKVLAWTKFTDDPTKFIFMGKQ
jgi:hypothetical protein